MQWCVRTRDIKNRKLLQPQCKTVDSLRARRPFYCFFWGHTHLTKITRLVLAFSTSINLLSLAMLFWWKQKVLSLRALLKKSGWRREKYVTSSKERKRNRWSEKKVIKSSQSKLSSSIFISPCIFRNLFHSFSLLFVCAMCVVAVAIFFFSGTTEKQAIFIAIPFDESQNFFLYFN